MTFGDVSTGSSSDLRHATEIARSMVTEYGMSAKLGPMFLGGEQEIFLGRNFSQSRSNISEEVSRTIDQEVHDLLAGGLERATAILKEHQDKLDAVAAALIDREKLDQAEFEAIMNAAPAIEAPAESEVPEESEAENHDEE